MSQAKPIPWVEFRPTAERSIHFLREIRAKLIGRVDGSLLTLEGSLEVLELAGKAPPAGPRVRVFGRIVIREAGRPAFEVIEWE